MKKKRKERTKKREFEKREEQRQEQQQQKEQEYFERQKRKEQEYFERKKEKKNKKKNMNLFQRLKYFKIVVFRIFHQICHNYTITMIRKSIKN